MSNKKATTADDLRNLIERDLAGALAHITAAEKNLKLLATMTKAGLIPTTPKEAIGRLAAELGEPPAHIRRAAAEVRAEYGYTPEHEEQPQKPAQAKKQTAKAKPVAKKPAAKQAKKAKKPAAAGQKAPDAQAKQGEGKVQPAPRHRTPASVILTPHEVTLNIGAHPVKELAEDDAKDMLNNPKVFWYRPIQFPDPRRYQVQPHVEAVKVIKRTNAKFTRAPWTCSVTISLIGDDKRCDSYGVGLLNKNKSEQE